jgi:hypothetical protein
VPLRAGCSQFSSTSVYHELAQVSQNYLGRFFLSVKNRGRPW